MQPHTFLHLLAGSASSSVSEEAEEPGLLSPAKNRAAGREKGSEGPPPGYGWLFPGLSMAAHLAAPTPHHDHPAARAVLEGT